MFSIGDVIRFHSSQAGKEKFHTCISLEHHFIFLNSPKKRIYPGDLVVSCSDIPFITATESGQSIICCSLVMKKDHAELTRLGAKKIGSIPTSLLARISQFVRSSPVLSEDEKDVFYEAAADWI